MRSKTSKRSRTPARPRSPKVESGCDESRLAELARELAAKLEAGDRVALEGPLGAGKTTFARYLLKGLGVTRGSEGSPSFPIVHEYQGAVGAIAHIDFYRLRSSGEIDEIGIPSYYWERTMIVISEWLSSWPELESQVLSSGRVWRVDLAFTAGSELKRDVRTERLPLRAERRESTRRRGRNCPR